MSDLGTEPKIIAMANALRVSGPDLVAGIRKFCQGKVRRILSRHSRVSNIGDLQAVVCEALSLRVREVWSDEQLTQLVQEYVSDGDPVFAILPTDLAPSTTLGVLIRRSDKEKGWVAIVDCRGNKHLRRFFTLWHEIAHCFTAVEQYELALFHRAAIHDRAKDSVETITDLIAGDFAFFDPLFNPLLEEEIARKGRLTFAGVERVRNDFARDASFQSTLYACVNRVATPILYVEADLAYKKAELALLTSGQGELIPSARPAPTLRVTDTFRNEAARLRGLHIPKKMSVPESSVISRVFLSGIPADSVEDLSDWSSQGRCLPALRVQVEARSGFSGVSAMITLG